MDLRLYARWVCGGDVLVSIVEMLCRRPWLIYPKQVSLDRTRNVTVIRLLLSWQRRKPTMKPRGSVRLGHKVTSCLSDWGV
jgi:hypothetical protein